MFFRSRLMRSSRSRVNLTWACHSSLLIWAGSAAAPSCAQHSIVSPVVRLTVATKRKLQFMLRYARILGAHSWSASHTTTGSTARPRSARTSMSCAFGGIFGSPCLDRTRLNRGRQRLRANRPNGSRTANATCEIQCRGGSSPLVARVGPTTLYMLQNWHDKAGPAVTEHHSDENPPVKNGPPTAFRDGRCQPSG